MSGRFQRGKVAGVSPFFAFQDIITSAMAVLIVIVMLLALDMGEGGPVNPADPADRSLTQRLQELLDQVSRTLKELRIAQDTHDAARDPARAKAEIALLREELTQVQQASQSSAKELAEARRHDGPKVVLSELEKQKAASTAAAKEIAKLEEEAARTLAEMQRAEEALREKEGQLLAEQAKKNELWLVPDRSKTSKEPVLAVVSADAVVLQRFDHPEKSELRGRKVASQFEAALKDYSKLDQYVVFYFKPSGVGLFEDLTESARTAGFEIGYDAVGEEIAINFSPAK
jgi:hypothetical protein